MKHIKKKNKQTSHHNENIQKDFNSGNVELYKSKVNKLQQKEEPEFLKLPDYMGLDLNVSRPNRKNYKYNRQNQLDNGDRATKDKHFSGNKVLLDDALQPRKNTVKDETNYMEEFSCLWTKYKARSTPHVQSTVSWVSQLLKEDKFVKPIPLPVRKKLHEHAERIYNDDTQAYKQLKSKQSSHDAAIQKNVLLHGTMKDKIAAHAVQCIDAPLYSLKDLQSLIEFVSPKVKTQRFDAIDNLISVFKTTYLPDGHVAREFECHNFKELIPLIKESPEKVEKQLVLWYFENQVRLAYLRFMRNLETISHDMQLKTKSQGLRGMVNLIRNHPNQDAENVLRKLVNKLGDSNRRISGEVSHNLTSLISLHPDLKVTLVSLIEEILYRSNVSVKTQYYGLCFLKDIIFRRNEQKLVEKLVKLYFDFFSTCSKKGEVDCRFMAAILRGLNRAYPFLQGVKTPFLDEQLSALYTLSHKVSFAVSTQALQLVYKIISGQETSDRFYNVLYGKLLDPGFGPGSSASAFLNLVFRAMCKDRNTARVTAFIRRLLQTATYQPPQIGCGILFLISEVVKDNPSLSNISSVFSNASSIMYSKQHDDSYDDDSGEDSGVVVKEDNNNCSSLSRNNESDDEILDICEAKRNENVVRDSSAFEQPHIKVEKSSSAVRTKQYALAHRNPSYCGANLCPIWELSELAEHYHPTVSLFAINLLNGVAVDYSGDPLEDFTMARFLDRFIHRNPKKKPEKNNKNSGILGSRSNYTPSGVRNVPVESTKFRNLDVEKIPVEDLFCYRYFTMYRKEKGIKRKVKEDDESSVEDEEFEDYLKRMKDAKNFGIGDEDEDDNIDFDFAQNVKKLTKEDNEDDALDDEFGNADDNDAFDNDDDEAADDGDDMDDEDQFDFGDSDIEAMSFSDESGEDIDDAFGKNSSQKGKKKLKKADKWSDLLADADEFSHLLEEAAGKSDLTMGTSEQLMNKDKSNIKQLQWEKKRGKEMFAGPNDFPKSKPWPKGRGLKHPQEKKFKSSNKFRSSQKKKFKKKIH